MAASNQIPPEIASYLWGGSITPLQKPSGGIRPVVPVESICRLITKAILSQYKAAIRKAFKRIQASVHPCGLETVTTTLRAVMHKHPSYIITCLDIKNAYGSMERATIRRGLDNLGLSDLTTLFDQIYAQPNNLLVKTATGPKTINVTRGVLQGETMSSIFFCAGLQPILLQLQDKYTDTHFIAFCDDIYIIGPADKVCQVTAELKGQLAYAGLTINTSKCKLVCNTDEQLSQLATTTATTTANLEGARVISLQSNATMVLGVPIGCKEKIAEFLEQAAKDIANDMLHLFWLDDTQISLLLLRYCGVTRYNYLIRSLPPQDIHRFTKSYDDEITLTLSRLLTPSKLTPDAQLQASLPVRMGGLGLQNTTSIHPAAYLASMADVHRLAKDIFPALMPDLDHFCMDQQNTHAQYLQHMVNYINNMGQKNYEQQCKEANSNNSPPAPPKKETLQQAIKTEVGDQRGNHRQHTLTSIIHQHAYNRYKESMIRRNRHYQLISMQQEGASTLYTTLPSSPSLRLPSYHMRIALCLRLSIDTLTVNPNHSYCPLCLQNVSTNARHTDTPWDYHRQTCLHGKAESHNDLQTTIRGEASNIGQKSTLAKVVSDGTGPELITDLMFPNLPGRNNRYAVVVDFSICHHSTPSSSEQPPTALARAVHVENEKKKKYQAACDAQNLDFWPIVFESTGAIGPSAKNFFMHLLANSAIINDDRVYHTSKLMQLVSVVLAKSIGNKFRAAFIRQQEMNASNYYSRTVRFNRGRHFH
jgi:hypothetical protein